MSKDSPPSAPRSGGPVSNQTRGPDAQRKKPEEGGEWGEKEEKERGQEGQGGEGTGMWRLEGKERGRPLSQVICVEIKNRPWPVGFPQPSWRALMGKIGQKNAADPW